MQQRSWLFRAIYQCPEKVSVFLASSWLYQLNAKGGLCDYYPMYAQYPNETISKN
jgi:hypothetical protein